MLAAVAGTWPGVAVLVRTDAAGGSVADHELVGQREGRRRVRDGDPAAPAARLHGVVGDRAVDDADGAGPASVTPLTDDEQAAVDDGGAAPGRLLEAFHRG